VSVACGVAVLVVGFVPLAGPVLGAVLGLGVSGWLLAGELLTRPLEERGLDRDARRALLRRHRGSALGFGIATQVFFLVPLGAIVVMPAAVVGSTTLARELLAEPPPVR
jgi:CysZ protein